MRQATSCDARRWNHRHLQCAPSRCARRKRVIAAARVRLAQCADLGCRTDASGAEVAADELRLHDAQLLDRRRLRKPASGLRKKHQGDATDPMECDHWILCCSRCRERSLTTSGKPLCDRGKICCSLPRRRLVSCKQDCSRCALEEVKVSEAEGLQTDISWHKCNANVAPALQASQSRAERDGIHDRSGTAMEEAWGTCWLVSTTCGACSAVVVHGVQDATTAGRTAEDATL